MNENTRINWIFNRVKDTDWKRVTVRNTDVMRREYRVTRQDGVPVVAILCCWPTDSSDVRIMLQKAAQCLLLSYDGCDCTLQQPCIAHMLAAQKDQIKVFQHAAEKLTEFNGETIRAFVIANYR